jgi:propanol-preferring alcohol dehydrogenase
MVISQAMILDRAEEPLRSGLLDIGTVKNDQVLVEVAICGVCRTDLHVLDGELTHPTLPLVLGHEIVGSIVQVGANVDGLKIGQRVGIPWLGETCGKCQFCLSHQENLCDNAIFTGYTRNGGYGQYAIANKDFCLPLPDSYDSVSLAPLLCAGLIGWRSYRLANESAGHLQKIGMYGFGAAAHILTQVAKHQGKEVYAFTRPGDAVGQSFARKIGAVWAGDSNASPPHELDAVIIFAPAGELVISALKAVRKGGAIICGGIHMSLIPSFSYDLLWGERIIRSVANLTREDAHDFLKVIAEAPIKIQTTKYKLAQANEALADLKAGRFEGAAVLTVKE